MSKKKSDQYYNEVGEYYDFDADAGFEMRAHENEGLKRIRSSFRSYVKADSIKRVLEIGCGPGLDALWAGETFPNAEITAIDVSAKMVETAKSNTSHLTNVKVLKATELEIPPAGGDGYDVVFVFFGALNTVDDLEKAAFEIYKSLAPGGKAVLTFVNKWYMRELIVNALKLNFKTAFARLGKVWGGYSVKRFLASVCYTPSYIRQCFGSFNELDRRGYSIVYPAWYNIHKLKGNDAKANELWERDEKLSKTPFWKFGEYVLFVFQKPI